MLVNDCRSDNGDPNGRVSDDVRPDGAESDWDISDDVGDTVPDDTN